LPADQHGWGYSNSTLLNSLNKGRGQILKQLKRKKFSFQNTSLRKPGAGPKIFMASVNESFKNIHPHFKIFFDNTG
jgi:hypothetical protein